MQNLNKIWIHRKNKNKEQPPPATGSFWNKSLNCSICIHLDRLVISKVLMSSLLRKLWNVGRKTKSLSNISLSPFSKMRLFSLQNPSSKERLSFPGSMGIIYLQGRANSWAKKKKWTRNFPHRNDHVLKNNSNNKYIWIHISYALILKLNPL